MESLLLGVRGVVVFLDDILISAPERKTHIKRLEEVLTILSKAGLKLASQKCEFFCKEIKYLGHVINKDGLHTNPDKVNEIKKLPSPTNVKELQSFLGMVNFYRRFIPEMSTLLSHFTSYY